MAGKVAWSACRSLMLAIWTSVVDVDSTLMTEAVGLATLILARPFIEIPVPWCFCFFLRSQNWLQIRISLLVDYHVFIIKTGVFLPLGPRRR